MAGCKKMHLLTAQVCKTVLKWEYCRSEGLTFFSDLLHLAPPWLIRLVPSGRPFDLSVQRPFGDKMRIVKARFAVVQFAAVKIRDVAARRAQHRVSGCRVPFHGGG